MNNVRSEATMHQALEQPRVNHYVPLQAAAAIAVLAGLIYMGLRNYLLFHSLIEMFSIITAFMLFTIAINTRRFISAQNGYVSILGISFGIIGFFDLLHTLAYKGMGVFPGSTSNLATELWIASRYLAGIALLITGMIIDRKVKARKILLLFAAVAAALFASIFIFDVFPDCYQEGYGLTDFKKISEVIISLTMGAGGVLLLLKRKAQSARTSGLLIASVVLTIASELSFMLYVDVYGVLNMFGHILKLASFYLIYKAIVEVNLRTPIIELTRSEKKYADLIERLPESILIYDDGGIVFANTAAARLFGANSLNARFAALLDQAPESRNGQDPVLERQVIRPDGSEAHVLIKTLPFFHQGRQANMAIIYDVTARKAAELATRRNAELQFEADLLRKNEQDYLEIINGSTEASWIYDFEHGTLNYSDAWKKRIGAEHVPDEEMNRFAVTLVYPEDVESVIRQRKATFDNKLTKYVCEYRMKTKSGECIWVYDQGKVIYGETGAPVKIYGTSMDMTERKNAEQALKDQNILLQTIVGNTYDDIMVIDPRGQTLYGQNRILGGIAASGEGASAGAAVSFFDMDGNEIPQDRLPVNRLRNGEAIKDEVYMAKSPAGRHYLLYGGKPICDDNGQMLYGILYSHDLTELINIQNALKQSEQTALELVEQLKLADRNKNDFLNALSHELRNPLAAIVAGFSLVNMTEDRQRINKAKAVIERQINQLCHLVDDLLDVTRITNNKIVLKKERVELVSLAAATVEDLQWLFARKGIRLEASLEPDQLFLDADPVRIKQIIGNLLQNAAKFTDKGGLVHVTVTADSRHAFIKVKDSGIGIKPEFLTNLFTPFNQASTSIDRSEGGLGLGLSIVKGIADLHGGSVRADSEGPGMGAEFIITLPIQDA